MKSCWIVAFIYVILPTQSWCQIQPKIFSTGEISRFDSLIGSGSHTWTLGGVVGDGSNEPTLKMLVKIYPVGIIWEQVEYSNDKHSNVTDRWFIITESSCKVYEQKKWNWGGTFGWINGVRIEKHEDFERFLEHDIGKPAHFED